MMENADFRIGDSSQVDSDFHFAARETSSEKSPIVVVVKRRRIPLAPKPDGDGDKPQAPLAEPKVYRLASTRPAAPVVAAAAVIEQPPRRRDPVRQAVLLRHEVFETVAAPRAGLQKYRDAMQTLTAIERDLRVAESCREFLDSFPSAY